MKDSKALLWLPRAMIIVYDESEKDGKERENIEKIGDLLHEEQ